MRQRNISLVLLCVVALLVMSTFTACNMGTDNSVGRLVIGFGQDRTIYPGGDDTWDPSAFENYRVVITKAGTSNSVVDKAYGKDDTIAVDLPVGAYDVTVYAVAGTAPEQVETASGTTRNVAVSSAGASCTIFLRAIGKGALEVGVSAQDPHWTVNNVSATLTKLGNTSAGPVDLTFDNGSLKGSDISSGTYLLNMQYSIQTAATTFGPYSYIDLVYIAPEKTSTASLELTLGGSASISILDQQGKPIAVMAPSAKLEQAALRFSGKNLTIPTGKSVVIQLDIPNASAFDIEWKQIGGNADASLVVASDKLSATVSLSSVGSEDFAVLVSSKTSSDYGYGLLPIHIEATQWNGETDITWYAPASAAPAPVAKSLSRIATPDYTLTSAAQLAGLAQLVNDGTESFANKTIAMSGLLILDGYEWTPIGTNSNPFKGTFIGSDEDAVVYGMQIDSCSSDNKAALFGQVADATISGVVLSNVNINAAAQATHVAPLVASSTGTTSISNVTVSSGTVAAKTSTGEGTATVISGLVGETRGSLSVDGIKNEALTITTDNFNNAVLGTIVGKVVADSSTAGADVVFGNDIETSTGGAIGDKDAGANITDEPEVAVTELYVASYGSDSNSAGTKLKPYATVTKALSALPDGVDTIVILNDITENIIITNPVTLVGQDKNTTTIKGNIVLKDMAVDSKVVIEGLTIEKTEPLNQAPTATGNSGNYGVVNVVSAVDLTVNDCYIHHTSTNTTSGYWATGIRVEGEGAKVTVNDTDIDVLYYGISVMNKNQTLSVNRSEITGWAAIRTKTITSERNENDKIFADAKVSISVIDSTLISRPFSEELYGAIVLQPYFNGVNLAVNDSEIRVDESRGDATVIGYTGCVLIRSYNNTVTIDNVRMSSPGATSGAIQLGSSIQWYNTTKDTSIPADNNIVITNSDIECAPGEKLVLTQRPPNQYHHDKLTINGEEYSVKNGNVDMQWYNKVVLCPSDTTAALSWYSSFASAFEVANDGDTLYVFGTVTENLTIPKGINIIGAGKVPVVADGNGQYTGSSDLSDVARIQGTITVTADASNPVRIGNLAIGSTNNVVEVKGGAPVTVSECLVYSLDDIETPAAGASGIRLLADGAKLSVENSVINAWYYGIGIRNKNQSITVKDSSLTGWAAIMTSAGGLEVKDGSLADTNTSISVDGTNLVSRTILDGDSNSYGAVVLQEKFNGVDLTINNSIIKTGPLANNAVNAEQTAALDLRSYGNTISLKNVTLDATDAVNSNHGGAVIRLGWHKHWTPNEDKSELVENTITLTNAVLKGGSNQKLVSSNRPVNQYALDKLTINGKSYTVENGSIYQNFLKPVAVVTSDDAFSGHDTLASALATANDGSTIYVAGALSETLSVEDKTITVIGVGENPSINKGVKVLGNAKLELQNLTITTDVLESNGRYYPVLISADTTDSPSIRLVDSVIDCIDARHSSKRTDAIRAYTDANELTIELNNSRLDYADSVTGSCGIYACGVNKDIGTINIVLQNGSSITDPLKTTLGGVRGLELESTKKINVTIQDSCIDVMHYAMRQYLVPFENAPDSYSATWTIDNSKLRGWSALYVQAGSSNTTINVTDSELIGTSVTDGDSNDFAALVIQDSKNVVYNISDSVIEFQQLGLANHQLATVGDAAYQAKSYYGYHHPFMSTEACAINLKNCHIKTAGSSSVLAETLTQLNTMQDGVTPLPHELVKNVITYDEATRDHLASAGFDLTTEVDENYVYNDEGHYKKDHVAYYTIDNIIPLN